MPSKLYAYAEMHATNYEGQPFTIYVLAPSFLDAILHGEGSTSTSDLDKFEDLLAEKKDDHIVCTRLPPLLSPIGVSYNSSNEGVPFMWRWGASVRLPFADAPEVHRRRLS